MFSALSLSAVGCDDPACEGSDCEVPGGGGSGAAGGGEGGTGAVGGVGGGRGEGGAVVGLTCPPGAATDVDGFAGLPAGYVDAAVDPAAAVVVETTMNHYAENTRGGAVDHQANTRFGTWFDPPETDRVFTLRFDRPRPLTALRIGTGFSPNDNGQSLPSGVVEWSTDGTTFCELTPFQDDLDYAAAGPADAAWATVIRIRPTVSATEDLSIHDIEVERDGVPHATELANPVNLSLYVAQEGDDDVFTQLVPDYRAMLFGRVTTVNQWLYPNAGGPDVDSIILELFRFDGVAYASTDYLAVNADYVESYLDANGAREAAFEVEGILTHEIAHFYQYGQGAPGWLVEGIADWVRLSAGYGNWMTSPNGNYTDGYQVTASFLHWIAGTYGADFVVELNARIGESGYSDGFFVELTGKTVDQLWTEYQASF